MRLWQVLRRRRARQGAVSPLADDRVTRLTLSDGEEVLSLVAVPLPAPLVQPRPTQHADVPVPLPRAGDAAAERAAIRAWARQQGLEVSDRGKLPQRVVEAYRAAH